MKKLYFQAGLGIALIIIGCALWWLRTNNLYVNAVPPIPKNSVHASAPVKSTLSGEPDLISIPSLNMTLPIIQGVYNTHTKTWTLSLNKVQYAVITPPPNNASGNTFLYGHYRSEVFARLHIIKLGSTAVVTTTNGHTFTYELENVRVTNPSDDSLFQYQGPPILTIQTCTGLFFQYRQLFTFKLVSAV